MIFPTFVYKSLSRSLLIILKAIQQNINSCFPLENLIVSPIFYQTFSFSFVTIFPACEQLLNYFYYCLLHRIYVDIRHHHIKHSYI